MGCDLEVDVNGEEVFMVDKEIVSAFSGKLRKLFSQSTSAANLKVIFHDLPGGTEAFELMIRFCYNSGQTQINPSNICLLHSIAHFMEMTEDVSSCNLIEQTENLLAGIAYWTWPEIQILLKQCQDLYPSSSASGLLQRCLDSLALRITSASETSPSTSSPDSAGLRLSCDTRSSDGTKFSYNRAWWFEDLAIFSTGIIEKWIKTLISHNFDHLVISRFLFYYLKARSSNMKSDEKGKLVETIIELLFLLDRKYVPCKGLFGVLRVTSSLNISKCCKNKLESMIGSQLDQAILDNLLVPAPGGKAGCLYDVNLVLRFVKSFLCGGIQASSSRLKTVGALMDMYVAEVAPDSCLKPSKFIALATALPESARDSYDGIYRAMDMYLEVHSGLSDEDKMKICCTLNYEKLSTEACKHLAQNAKFPSRTTTQALISQQSRLRSLLQDTDSSKSFDDSSQSFRSQSTKGERPISEDQVVLYAKKLDLSKENENLKAHLQGMQWRVMELEKICRKMQTQMAKIMKSKLPSPNNPRSLPKLCS